MKRVNTIKLTIPENKLLVDLLTELSNLNFNKSLSTNLPDLKPQTVISHEEIEAPQLSFITNDRGYKESWNAGNLRFGFNLKTYHPVTKSKEISKLSLGKETVSLVSIDKLKSALTGNLKELNHFGINLGPTIIRKKIYLDFRSKLAKRGNLYSYPTGEEWPFLIPSTDEEFMNKIEDESIDRNPKFELVYSTYHPDPLIQFDIETHLTRNQLEDMFPKPFGTTFENLEDMFRVVFVKTNWNGVLLRFDLGYRKQKKDFGYWVIRNGKRY